MIDSFFHGFYVVDDRLDHRPDARLDAGLDTGLDHRPEARSQARLDSGLDTRLDVRLDPRPDAGLYYGHDSRYIIRSLTDFIDLVYSSSFTSTNNSVICSVVEK